MEICLEIHAKTISCVIYLILFLTGFHSKEIVPFNMQHNAEVAHSSEWRQAHSDTKIISGSWSVYIYI